MYKYDPRNIELDDASKAMLESFEKDIESCITLDDILIRWMAEMDLTDEGDTLVKYFSDEGKYRMLLNMLLNQVNISLADYYFKSDKTEELDEQQLEHFEVETAQEAAVAMKMLSIMEKACWKFIKD